MTNQEISFYKIRDFILFAQKENMEKAANNNEQWKPCNWKLDRLNFGSSISSMFHGHSFEETLDKVLFISAKDPQNAVEKITGLRAIVLTEGEFCGEVFLLSSGVSLTDDEYEKVFAFAETECPGDMENDGKRNLFLRIDPRDTKFAELAKKHGYEKNEYWIEKESVIKLDSKKKTIQNHLVELPNGYTLIDNTKNEIKPEMRVLVHYNAFQVYSSNKTPLTQKMIEEDTPAWIKMTQQPDYNPYLDLMILSPNKEPCAIMGFWFDSINKIGIIEPAGTRPEFQRKGLGRYLIEEGALRLKKLGAKELWVGNEMDFYTQCGFQSVHGINVWQKKI